MNDSLPIAVVGGGIAGLACAIALRRLGISVRVFERSEAPHELGAGITLWPNAMTILERWGLAGAIQSQGSSIENGYITNSRGRKLLHTPVGAVSREFASAAVGIHRATLLRVLLDAVPGDSIEYGREFVGAEDGPDGVALRFADGRTHRSSLLIGADGIRSAVFRSLHGDVPLRYAGYVCYRGIAPYAGEVLPFGYAFEAWGPGRRFGAIRLDEERVYWFANENAHPEVAQARVNLPRLRDTFASWPAPIPEVLAAVDQATTLCHAIHDRSYLKGQRGRGRVALAGDAAHPMTPDLGQGACQAMEDAATLAQCLGSNSDPIAALRRFEDTRWSRVAWIVRRSRFQGWVGQHSTRIGCRLRDFLIRRSPASMMRKAFRDLVQPQGSAE
jgi:2-polyprenyl-6-methoxyphenol hydroxylase-like FAD-dependent oxidoreductase